MVAAVEADETVAGAPARSAPSSGFVLRRPSDLFRFGAVTMALSASASPMTIYLPAYYGGYVGLAIGQVGLALLIVRLFDIGFDPMMGVLLDRTRTRFGQARPWLIAGVCLMTLASPWLYLAPKGVGLPYLIVGMLVVYAGFSMANVSFAAWGARLVREHNARNRLWGWAQVCGYVATFLLFVAPLMFARHNAIKDGTDVHVMGWILTIGVPIVAFIALVGIPEPPVPRASDAHARRVKLTDYVRLLRIPNVRTIVIADAILTIASGTTAVLFLLFWQFGRGYSRPEGTILILTYMVAGFIGTFLWVNIARRIGKKPALMASLACYAVIIPGVALAPRGHLLFVILGQFLLGLTYAAGIFLLRSMAADTADEIRHKLNMDRTGQLFGLFGSTAKIGTALGTFYALGVLQVFGFDAKLGLHNTPKAILALELLYLVAPGILMLIGALILLPYKLSQREHHQIVDDLAARDEAAAALEGL